MGFEVSKCTALLPQYYHVDHHPQESEGMMMIGQEYP